jgi:hypothetical protein
MASKAYELITQVKKLCLIAGTSEDEAILRFLNLIQWETYNLNFRWRALEVYPAIATTAATAYVAVPATLGMIYDVRLSPTTSGPYGKVSYVDPHKFQELIPLSATPSSGTPNYFTWWGGRIYFYPTPDAVYNLTVYGYSKPVNMKLYSVGTATAITTAVTGTGTQFLGNVNVDNTMFFGFPADIRSDGTLPWTTITTVSSATALVIPAYTGLTGATTTAYVISSASSFPEDFDQLLILGAAIMHTARLRELNTKFMEWLQQAYSKAMTGLLDSQTHVPDYTPVLQRYIPGQRDVMGDPIHKLPIIPKELLGVQG